MKKKYMIFTTSIAIALALGGEFQSVGTVVKAQEIQQVAKNVKQESNFDPAQYAEEVNKFIGEQTETDAKKLFEIILNKEQSDIEKYSESNTEQIKLLWGSGVLFNFVFTGNSCTYTALSNILSQSDKDLKNLISPTSTGEMGFYPNTKSQSMDITNKEDGKTIKSVAYFTPHKNNSTNADKTVVIHGGYRGNIDSGYDMDEVGVFYNLGYNILLVDNRATSKSTGDYVTFGQYESDDVIAWINYLNDTNPGQKVVLYGGSMGAATMMSVLAKDHPTNIKGLIENCGYANISDELTYAYSLISEIMPILGTAMGLDLKNNLMINSENAQEMLKTMDEYYIKPKANVDINGNLPANGVENTVMPKLFIHGEADNIVPFENGQYLSTLGNKDDNYTFFVPKAGHGEAQATDPEGYLNAITKYLDVIFK
ncbi:alpha/beta hydrolase [Pediococcus pentosaceus]|uniref:alpha/beta hydrolase n=1 Tax=Pediococcus pentosaceus TaxID=1255 RepID=UPI002F26D4D5